MKRKIYLIVSIIIVFVSGALSQTAQPTQLWGTTIMGGANDKGVIFAINHDGTGFTIYHSFAQATGYAVEGILTRANNGKLYGVASAGGFQDRGVIFSIDPSTSVYTPHVYFNGTNGNGMLCNLLLASDGNLYGVTGASNGVLFRFNPATNNHTVLLRFPSQTGSKYPYGSLIQASNGLIYGLTLYSNQSGSAGTIFSFNITNNQYTLVKDFYCGPNGFMSPFGKMVQASDGRIYGEGQGSSSPSTGCVSKYIIFSLDPVTNDVITYSTTSSLGTGNSCAYGGGLVEARPGLLFTQYNNDNQNGGILTCTLSGDVSVPYYYDNSIPSQDGDDPTGHLMLSAIDNNLYGMIRWGGLYNGGTLFRYDPDDNIFLKLRDFSGGKYDGKSPVGDLIEVTPPPCTAVPAKPSAIVPDTTGGVCPGDDRWYSVKPVSGVRYNWTTPANSTIVSGAGTARIKVHFENGFNASGVLSVRSQNNCGINTNATTFNIAFNIPAQPGAITVNKPGAVCNTDTRVYTVPEVLGLTYNWTPPTGMEITIGENRHTMHATFTSAFVSSGILSVTASSACATGPARTLMITKGTPPTVSAISGPSKACPNEQVTFSVTNITGVTYYWSVSPPAAAGSFTNGFNQVQFTMAAGYPTASAPVVVSVYGTSKCGNSTVKSKSFTRNNPAQPGLISQVSGTTKICPGDVNSYKVTAVAGMFYDWLPPSGAEVTNGQGTATATIRFNNDIPNNAILSVKAVNLCGISAARTRSLSPDIPANAGAITGPANVCTGQQYTYSVAAISGAIGYIWSIPSGSSFISGNLTRSITIQMGSSSGNVTVLPYGRCNFANNNTVKQVTVTSCLKSIAEPAYVLDGLELFHNPLHDNSKFSLRFTSPAASLYHIQIMDISGKVLMTRTYQANKGINSLEMNTGKLSGGVYLVALRGKDIYDVKKFFVH